MVTSGTKTFELAVDDYIEEAFERCGLEARTGYDARTARRSLNLLLADWANRGINQWTIEQGTAALTANTSTYALDTGTIDVLDAVVREGSGSTQVDTSISRISRSEYLNLASKSTTARPNQFYVERDASTTSIVVWPVPANSGVYTLVYNRLMRMDDVATSQNTMEVPFRFYPALAAGLAYYIAIKRAPDKVEMLKMFYEEELARAASEDRDRASLFLVPGRWGTGGTY